MKVETLSFRRPCSCGGCLAIGGSLRKNSHLVHLVIKCRKCGAWLGGFMVGVEAKKKKREK